MVCRASLPGYKRNFSGSTKEHKTSKQARKSQEPKIGEERRVSEGGFGREEKHLFIRSGDLTYTVTSSHDPVRL